MTDLPRENVRSYTRPLTLEPVPQLIIIQLGGALVADTTRSLRVLEAHHAPTYYLPPEDIPTALRPATGSSFLRMEGRCALFRRAGKVGISAPLCLALRPTHRTPCSTRGPRGLL
jgi:uncharacterized protein (DUF427 family)